MTEPPSDTERAHDALTEGLFRRVNENLSDLNEAFGSLTGDIAVVCECASRDCIETVTVPEADYNRVRADDTQFFVIPGHTSLAIETVLEEHDGWLVVRKHPGTPARLAAATAL